MNFGIGLKPLLIVRNCTVQVRVKVGIRITVRVVLIVRNCTVQVRVRVRVRVTIRVMLIVRSCTVQPRRYRRSIAGDRDGGRR